MHSNLHAHVIHRIAATFRMISHNSYMYAYMIYVFSSRVCFLSKYAYLPLKIIVYKLLIS